VTSGTFIPNALRHPEFLVSYEIGKGICFGIGGRRMRFSGRREMTFRAPIQTAAVPPMTFVLGHGLPLIGFVTLPNSAAHENSPLRVTCTTLAGQTNHAPQMHHSAVANVGNLRWHLF